MPGGRAVNGHDRSMTSWRDGASEQCQQDLDDLLNATLRFAQNMLQQHGEFYPFAAAVTTDGEKIMLSTKLTGNEHLDSSTLITETLATLQRDRDGLRATAIVADVRAASADAIRVELEHREGQTVSVQLSYTKKRFRNIAYGNLTASSLDRRVWPQTN